MLGGLPLSLRPSGVAGATILLFIGSLNSAGSSVGAFNSTGAVSSPGPRGTTATLEGRGTWEIRTTFDRLCPLRRLGEVWVERV